MKVTKTQSQPVLESVTVTFTPEEWHDLGVIMECAEREDLATDESDRKIEYRCSCTTHDKRKLMRDLIEATK